MNRLIVKAFYWPVLMALMLAAACSTPKTSSIHDLLETCKSDDGPADALCGTLEVFEDREAATGRKIPLKIIVLPALGNDPKSDPLFFLAGGPGGGAADMAAGVKPVFARMQSDRDIVLVDQRGTGESNPLKCELGEDSLEDLSKAGEMPLEKFQACLDGYDADAKLYTTSIAMDDLDDVRQFLGYGAINIYGGSYGTRAALVYLRRHGEHVRAVVLDGVAPPNMRLPLYIPRDGQRALDLLISDCEADAACRERFPTFGRNVQSLFARLDAKPSVVRLVHPRTGEAAEVTVKRELVAGVIMSALYSPLLSSLLPNLLERANEGDFQGLVALASVNEGAADMISQGMYYSVVCAEDAPRVTPEEIEKESAGTFLGGRSSEMRLQPCEFWPKGDVAKEYYEPVVSDAPVLILSGKLDPVTPPVWGEQVLEHLPNARHIVVPGAGHGAFGQGCVSRLIREFVDQADAQSLDAACVEKIHRPPFFVNNVGPRNGENIEPQDTEN
jgi:pimeloyl-ACP methyl ester carboxylesterase